MPVFANAGIERRYSCVPIEWYETAAWLDRAQRALSRACRSTLLEQAARDALAAGRARSRRTSTAIVVVSTTGIATPSLDALLIERLRLAPRRAAAADLRPRLRRRRARPGARRRSGARRRRERACCSWSSSSARSSFRKDDISKSNIVATALFGDGAAAAVHLRAAATARRSGAARRVHLAAIARHHGLGRRRGRAEARSSRATSRRWCAPDCATVAGDFLARHDSRSPTSTVSSAIPAAPRCSMRSKRRFGLAAGALGRRARRAARLRQHVGGDRALRARAHAATRGSAARMLMTALGPGFTAGFLMLERPAMSAVADHRRAGRRCSGWRELRLRRAQHRARCSPAARVEIGPRHYPLIVLLHARVAGGARCDFVPAPTRPILALARPSSSLLQGRALWVIASLGPLLDDADHHAARRAAGAARALSLRAPSELCSWWSARSPCCRWCSAPWRIALVFSLLNLALLAWRIRVEEQALAPRASYWARAGASRLPGYFSRNARWKLSRIGDSA